MIKLHGRKWSLLKRLPCCINTQLDPVKIKEYNERQYVPKIKTAQELDHDFVPFKTSPVYENGNQLRSYQLEGLNWLAHCYHSNRNSILGE